MSVSTHFGLVTLGQPFPVPFSGDPFFGGLLPGLPVPAARRPDQQGEAAHSKLSQRHLRPDQGVLGGRLSASADHHPVGREHRGRARIRVQDLPAAVDSADPENLAPRFEVGPPPSLC